MIKTNPFNVAYSLVIAIMLNIAFTNIFIGTYDIVSEPWMFSIMAIVFVVLFVILNLRANKWFGIVGFVVVIALIAFLAYADTFGIRSAFMNVYDFMHYLVTRKSPRVTSVKYSQDSLAAMFGFLSALPAFFTTWSLIRKNTIIPAILCYMIYLVPSVFTSGRNAAFMWYVVTCVGMVLLIVFECMRKSDSMSRDVTIAFITLPVFVICLVLSLVFPLSNYNMRDVAIKHYNTIMNKIDDTFGTTLKKNLERGSTYSPAISKNPSSFQKDITVTNLAQQGHKDESTASVMDVCLYLEDGVTNADIGKIYLQRTSMSSFVDNTWNRFNEPLFTNDSIISGDYEDTASAGWMAIKTLAPEEYAYMYKPSNSSLTLGYGPFTTAIYDLNGNYELYENYTENADSFMMPDVFDAVETVANNSDLKEYSYKIRKQGDPAIQVPDWNPEYLKYVENNCTFVPRSTEEAILNSGMLPDWFLAVREGRVEMTDAQKVTAVMYFVYRSAEYTTECEYLPEGEDFVAWFLKDSRLGYCVHFATATAVLLRMLDVPTRYVTGYVLPALEPNSLPATTATSVIMPEDQYHMPTINHSAVEPFTYTVTANEAHAWCEYFDPELGWVGFDPTNNMYVPGSRPYVPSTNIVEDESFKREVDFAGDSTGTVIAEEFEPEEIIEAMPNFFTGRGIVTLLLLLFAALLGLRLANIISWRKKFTTGSNNDKVRSMCRYATEITKHNDFLVPDSMLALTEVAMYSRRGCSDEEVEKMQMLTRDLINSVLKSKSSIKRFWEELVYIVPV